MSKVDTSTQIFGRHYDFPIAIAPTGYQKLAGFNGELGTTSAAHAIGTNFVLSSSSTTPLEEVISALPQRDSKYARPWFQLYFLKNRDTVKSLIQRVEKAGFEALVLTCDSVVIGNRHNERKNPLKLPPGMRRYNGKGAVGEGSNKSRQVLNARTAAEAREVRAKWEDQLVDPSLEWHEVIPWLRSQTKLKVIIKGIMTAEDAIKAVDAGADGVYVSNHGGRQLDGLPSTLEALAEVVDAIKGKVPIIFDGGIRRGSDVFKALALGADLCLIGRPALFGLAYNGQEGVEDVLHILERELYRTMSLTGASSIGEIKRGMVGVPKVDSFGVAKL